MTPHKPRLRMKVGASSGEYAWDFFLYLTKGDGKNLLGQSPGASRTYRVAGLKFIANRLRCGGICIKETNPQARKTEDAAHGWAGVYDEKGGRHD